MNSRFHILADNMQQLILNSICAAVDVVLLPPAPLYAVTLKGRRILSGDERVAFIPEPCPLLALLLTPISLSAISPMPCPRLAAIRHQVKC